MPLHLTRSATAVALALSVGLVALPACKKKAPTTAAAPAPDAGPPVPNPNPNPNPTGPTGADGRDAAAPRSPVFATSAEAPMRMLAQNNMKQILLALHNYHDVYQALPGGYADKTGKAGLSWRVAILPFIEQDSLFKMFKLDEPWDSPTNKALISKMPMQFAPPRTATNGYTFTRGFTGPNTWLPQQTGKPGQPIPGVRITAITDGTSNTILVADAGEPVIWTKPDEMQFAPTQVPPLGGVFQSGMVVGMGDGSVRFIRKGVELKTLANAIQINDGNVVDLDR